jgi:MFS family permease
VPDLRRLQLAAAVAAAFAPACSVALSVHAYRAGGPTAVAAVALATMLPAAVLAPFAAVLADRCRTERVLLWAVLARATAFATVASSIALDLPLVIVCTAAAAGSLAARTVFPAQLALIPRVAGTDARLVAANGVAAAVENVGAVVGPAIGGALLAIAGAAAVYAVGSAATAATAVSLARLRPPPRAEEPQRESPLASLTAGFTAAGRLPVVRTLALSFAAGCFLFAVVDAVLVSHVLDELELGGSGLGLVATAIGLGGVVGGLLVVTAALAGRSRATLLGGFTCFGCATALAGTVPGPAAFVALFVVAGIGNTAADVATFSLLQSATAEHVRARVFGVVESLAVGASGLGSLGGAALVLAAGSRAGLAAAGAGAVAVGLFTRAALSARPSARQFCRRLRTELAAFPR